MYRIRLFTDFGNMHLASHFSTLPSDEFLKCYNERNESLYINRKEIRYYKVQKDDLSKDDNKK